MLPMKYSRNLALGFAFGFTAIVTLSGFATLANAQGRRISVSRGLPAPPKITDFGGGVYGAQGGAVGANTAFIVGTDGVFVFDLFEHRYATNDLRDEIAKITPKPVTHIIFSHSNPDHVNGIFGFPRGLTIISQKNTAWKMEAIFHYLRDGERQHYLPTHTVDKRADLKIHGVNITLLHWAPAHTDGDLVGYLPDQKFAFIGDLGTGKNVHLEDLGSTEGAIETLKGIIALDADTYLRGHGDHLTKAQLQESLAEVIADRAKIVQLFEAGKSLDEAEKEMGETGPVVGGGRNVPRSIAAAPAGLRHFRPGRNLSYTEIVYTELSRQNR